MTRHASSPATARQRGAATLIIVMVLFLVMALLAAYASRSLLFEQRIASSYARASLAQEAAEGGIEWTLAQLNGPPIDGACVPKDAGGQRFMDKYLQLDVADRTFQLNKIVRSVMVDCQRSPDGTGWACQCPELEERTEPAAAAGDDITPSFGVILDTGPRNGTLRVKVLGCTASVVDRCVGVSNAAQRSKAQLALSTLDSLVALVGAVRTPPATPLTVKGDLTMTGTGLGLHNTDARSAGTLLAIGGTWTGMNDERMEGVPGTALSELRVQGDPALRDAPAGDDVFKMFMGMTGAHYRHHPALREVTCAGDCSEALAKAYAAGQRMLWVNGALQISSNTVIGSVDDPVLIVAQDIVLGGPFQINGMLVAQGNLTWTNSTAQPSQVSGMVLVTGSMSTHGAMDISYQQAVADRLRNGVGSFVRVPGGWQDGI
ncbi:MAG: PilX N-terminal domain-containing pilus assembly protein [Roseateles sp.]|uniref:pilus assembly PilX family protein n=1 Tax=Roseateles sp. TaxID=1971397 RepID=UPI0039ECE490